MPSDSPPAPSSACKRLVALSRDSNRKVTFNSEVPPGTVIHAVDHDPIFLALNLKDDPMGKVDKLSDVEGELSVLTDYGAALRQPFERIDRLDESAKPAFCGFRLFPDITDEPNIVLGINQRQFCDVNLKCQASPEVLLTPDARA